MKLKLVLDWVLLEGREAVVVNNSIIYHLEDDIIQDCAVVEGGGHDDGAYEDCLFTNCLVALP